jgi:hypothetical protein
LKLGYLAGAIFQIVIALNCFPPRPLAVAGGQGRDANTNIKGNNNHVTNVINQAANSGNGGNKGSGGSGDLPTCRILCSVIK